MLLPADERTVSDYPSPCHRKKQSTAGHLTKNVFLPNVPSQCIRSWCAIDISWRPTSECISRGRLIKGTYKTEDIPIYAIFGHQTSRFPRVLFLLGTYLLL